MTLQAEPQREKQKSHVIATVTKEEFWDDEYWCPPIIPEPEQCQDFVWHDGYETDDDENGERQKSGEDRESDTPEVISQAGRKILEDGSGQRLWTEPPGAQGAQGQATWQASPPKGAGPEVVRGEL